MVRVKHEYETPELEAMECACESVVCPMDNQTVQTQYSVKEIGTDPRQATFDGGAWCLKENREYAAYYPYWAETSVVSVSSLAFTFEGQNQTGNVGATSPLEVGGYYAWAEIETKDSYTNSNYKYGTFPIKKYNSNGISAPM